MGGVCRRLDVETLFRRCLPMIFSLETSSSRYSSSVTIHRIGGTPNGRHTRSIGRFAGGLAEWMMHVITCKARREACLGKHCATSAGRTAGISQTNLSSPRPCYGCRPIPRRTSQNHTDIAPSSGVNRHPSPPPTSVAAAPRRFFAVREPEVAQITVKTMETHPENCSPFSAIQIRRHGWRGPYRHCCSTRRAWRRLCEGRAQWWFSSAHAVSTAGRCQFPKP